MKDPFNNYKKLQDAINRTSRVANLIEMQNQRFEKAFHSAALMPTNSFHSAIATMPVPQMVSAFETINSKCSWLNHCSNFNGFTVALNAFANSGVLQSNSYSSMLSSLTKPLNLFADACKVSSTIANSLDIGRSLSESLTFPPVFSISSIANNIKTIMVDEETGEPTDAFYAFADELSLLPAEELWYSTYDDGTVEFSPGISTVIEDSFPETVIEHSQVNGKFKLSSINSNLIINLIMLALTVATFVFSQISDNQTADYRQEMLSLQRQEVELLKELTSSPELDNCEVNVESSNQNYDNH